MERIMLILFIFMFCTAIPCFSSWKGNELYKTLDQNFVKNPGFEKVDDNGFADGWSADQSVYSLDGNVAHSGQRSIKFENNDPEKNVMCIQKTNLNPGEVYEISCWIKTQKIQGDDYGASLCVEWFSEDGWLGGHYPSGIKGTAHWSQVKSIAGPIPDEAKSCHVVVYVREGMTGVAWFDDVVVKKVTRRPMNTVLLEPNYRGYIIGKSPEKISVQIELNLGDYQARLKDMAILAKLLTAKENEQLEQVKLDNLNSGKTIVQLPVPTVPGDYILSISLHDKRSGEIVLTEKHQIIRKSEKTPPKVYIDKHNRVIIDDKPFFPLGMYWSGVNEHDLDIYAKSPFNCLMPYGINYGDINEIRSNLEKINKRGLKIIYSIKDFYEGTPWYPEHVGTYKGEEEMTRGIIKEFRDHPALLAWYLNDELPVSMLDRLIKHQKWVEELDQNHPTWIVMCHPNEVGKYIGSFDIIGTDPYPIPNGEPKMAGDWTRITREQVADARPMWQVPQVFNWGVYREGKDIRPPTYEEMNCMAWQCIIEGAKGLIFYSFKDLKSDPLASFEERWEDVVKVAKPIAEMSDVLLSDESVPRIDVRAPESIRYLLKRFSGNLYLFAVNDENAQCKATFDTDADFSHVDVLFENRSIDAENGGISDSFDGLAVHIYKILP